MPTRIVSNGNVTVWWVTSIADPSAPTAAEINAGLNISEAISWNNFELGSSGSADSDDRSIVDIGNSVSRGFVDFGATLDFFYEGNAADTNSIYAQAFTLFRASSTGLAGFIVVRYGQELPTEDATAGQLVSVYKFVTDYISDDTEGEDSVKFEVVFLPQGIIHEHAIVKTAGALVALPATLTMAAGAKDKIVSATVGTFNAVNSASYSSSDTTKATVSQTGVVKGIAAGSATITVSHPGATTSDTVAVTVS